MATANGAAAADDAINSLNSLIDAKAAPEPPPPPPPPPPPVKKVSVKPSSRLKDDDKGPPKGRRENGLRRGKWTVEEEAYANRLIHEFKLGLLPLTDGTTLRTFLSKLLNCDPMRISKKFVGQNCIGKQVFRRRQLEMDRLSPEDIKRARFELAELERRFLTRVAQSHRSVKATDKGKNKGPTGALAAAQQRPMVAPWLLPPHAQPCEAPTVRAGAGAVAIAAPFGLPRDYGQRPSMNHPAPPVVPAADQARAKAALEGLKLPTLPSDASLASLGLSGGRPRGGSFASETGPLPSWPSAKDLGQMDTPGAGPGMSSWPSFSKLIEASGSSAPLPAPVALPPPPPPPPVVEAAAPAAPPVAAPVVSVKREAPIMDFGDAKRPRGETAPLAEAPASSRPMSASIRNSSVENFLSLVTSGDLPAPAPDLLSMPLSHAVRGAKAPGAAAQAPGAPAAVPPPVSAPGAPLLTPQMLTPQMVIAPGAPAAPPVPVAPAVAVVVAAAPAVAPPVAPPPAAPVAPVAVAAPVAPLVAPAVAAPVALVALAVVAPVAPAAPAVAAPVAPAVVAPVAPAAPAVAAPVAPVAPVAAAALPTPVVATAPAPAPPAV